MAVQTPTQTMPDTYFELVKQFPLARIRDDAHLGLAHEVIDHLLQQDLDDGSQQYLDVLADLVESYEHEQVTIPDASEADVLRELMRANNINQTRLANATGVKQSTISEVLSGDRSLTKQQVVKFAEHFNVSPAAFLQVRRPA